MVQEVNWFGVVSVGMLGHASFGEPMEYGIGALDEGKDEEQGSHQLSGTILRFEPQVQGPVCDSMGKLVGWHTFDGFHLEDRVFKGPDKSHEGRLEWAGFVLNARAVWEAGSDEPVWLDSWLNWTRSSGDKNLPDIQSILRDDKRVKLLGGCGHQVLLWWARMEAHANSSYPSKLVCNPLSLSLVFVLHSMFKAFQVYESSMAITLCRAYGLLVSRCC